MVRAMSGAIHPEMMVVVTGAIGTCRRSLASRGRRLTKTPPKLSHMLNAELCKCLRCQLRILRQVGGQANL